MGGKTKIDWCDSTWSPVTGCLHGCEYCYARRIAKRYGGFESRENGKFTSPYGDEMLVLDEPVRKKLIENVGYYDVEPGVIYCGVAPYPNFFNPTLHRYKLDEPQRWKKPRNIFVCSMADLFGDWVPDEWIRDVFKACEAAPQHRYLLLTKNPSRYLSLAKDDKLPNGDNYWYGSTATRKSDVFWWAKGYNTFLSVEPILEPFHRLGDDDSFVNWIIVGAETGNRKSRVKPEKEWIMELAANCERTETPIFMKESLRELMGDDFRQEYPWD